MIILAIETSCDETGISILKATGRSASWRIEILSNIVASQVKIHSKWGGVVPNLAKREHQKNLIPVLEKALKKAGLLKIENISQGLEIKRLKNILKREPGLLEQLLQFIRKHQKPNIDFVAVTTGPGLEPALWMGINFAKSLSIAWEKPLIPINHLEGHLFSVFLKGNLKLKTPAVSLLVSGGHTQLVLVKDFLKYEIIGETLDDAAGEAFDKVARMLKLGYPGGPVIAQEAEKFKKNKSEIELPRPMIHSKDFNFSFSGLKTAVLYKVKEIKNIKKLAPEIAKEFQQAVIDVLVSKTIKAAKQYKAKTIILGGGVAANKELRNQLKKAVSKMEPKPELLLPEIKFTGDNAAMIAAAAYFRAERKSAGWRTANLSKLKANGNLKLR